jgi:cytochrome P450
MIPWLSFGAEPNPFDRFNPLRPLSQWYYARKMNQYLFPILEARIAALQESKSQSGQPVIDLALLSSSLESSSKSTDPAFKAFVAAQAKLFLFAGHDTTSATLCYIFYLLARDPQILDRVRAEHDTVFGTDVSQAADLLREQPHLVHKLTFTTAVIKETLRVYPPSSSARGGEPGFSVIDHKTGLRYPTEGCMVWSNHDIVHHDPALWHRAGEFLPDRWLVLSDDLLHPVKGAWRPFEHGPRNCIGQELTMLEAKVVLVMTLRTISIVADYGDRTEQVDGEKAYQTGIGSPCLGLPCRITKIKS